ncbi:MAG: ABC transporter permease [Deinococcus sp.]|nr:ABC transporter permease [Deinococcus sp.]
MAQQQSATLSTHAQVFGLAEKPTSLWLDAWRRVRRNRLAMAGAAVVILLVFTALFAPWLAPYDPNVQNLRNFRQAPSREHWLGTDTFGRDILSRVIYGARISMQVAFLAEVLAAIIGVTLGALAGYFRGHIEDFVLWLMGVIYAFPFLLFVIAFTAAFGGGLTNVYIALGVASWGGIARIVRGQFLQLREMAYVEAARALGGSNLRIIFKHILPNIMSPIIVVTTLGFGTAILAEATLSFLGLGAQPPTPSWGRMVIEGQSYIFREWWLAFGPGAAIFIAVLGFNLLGDGLRDALDPRSAGSAK